jgi:flagellar hook-associated protein FlgK
MKIEKLKQDWDITAQMIALTNKVNEIIDYLESLNKELKK